MPGTPSSIRAASLGLLDPALGWASAAIDGALGSVAAEDPGRLRRWFTESEVERRTVRAAHDMLRHRYELDLARVAQAEIDGGR